MHTMRALAACLLVSGVVAKDVCEDVTDRFGASRKARVVGEQCATDADCVNNDVRNDLFQPAWLQDDRHHVEHGLICNSTTKLCNARRADYEPCSEDSDCQSRMCHDRLTGNGVEKRCLGVGELRLGEQCPTPTLHAACEGDAHCFPSDINAPEGASVYVCRKYALKDEECYNVWNAAGDAVVEHTCSPMYGRLFCEHTDSRGAPGPVAGSFRNRLRVGTCRGMRDFEVSEGESCVFLPNTSVRPDCGHDQFCNTSALNATCEDRQGYDDPCKSDEECDYGALCNVTVAMDGTRTGVCLELFNQEEGAFVQDTEMCEFGLYRNASGICVAESVGETCAADSDCLGQTMYCDKAAAGERGTCKSFVPDACDEQFEEFRKYYRQMQREGNFYNVLTCDNENCFSDRSLDILFKSRVESLTCCMWSKADDSSCTALADDQIFMPFVDVTGAWQWRAVHLEDHEADICSPSGLSAFELAIIIVVSLLCGSMCAFVLIKELVLPKPEDEEGEPEQRSAYHDPEAGKTSPEPAMSGAAAGSEPVY